MKSPLVILLAEDNPGDVFLVREALREHRLEFELFVAETVTRSRPCWNEWVKAFRNRTSCF